jgi:hypothetical protein
MYEMVPMKLSIVVLVFVVVVVVVVVLVVVVIIVELVVVVIVIVAVAPLDIQSEKFVQEKCRLLSCDFDVGIPLCYICTYIDKQKLYVVFAGDADDRSNFPFVLSVRRSQPYLWSAVVLC